MKVSLLDHYQKTLEQLLDKLNVSNTSLSKDWTLDKIKGTKHLSSEHPTPQKPTEKAFYLNLNIGGWLP